MEKLDLNWAGHWGVQYIIALHPAVMHQEEVLINLISTSYTAGKLTLANLWTTRVTIYARLCIGSGSKISFFMLFLFSSLIPCTTHRRLYPWHCTRPDPSHRGQVRSPAPARRRPHGSDVTDHGGQSTEACRQPEAQGADCVPWLLDTKKPGGSAGFGNYLLY